MNSKYKIIFSIFAFFALLNTVYAESLISDLDLDLITEDNIKDYSFNIILKNDKLPNEIFFEFAIKSEGKSIFGKGIFYPKPTPDQQNSCDYGENYENECKVNLDIKPKTHLTISDLDLSNIKDGSVLFSVSVNDEFNEYSFRKYTTKNTTNSIISDLDLDLITEDNVGNYYFDIILNEDYGITDAAIDYIIEQKDTTISKESVVVDKVVDNKITIGPLNLPKEDIKEGPVLFSVYIDGKGPFEKYIADDFSLEITSGNKTTYSSSDVFVVYGLINTGDVDLDSKNIKIEINGKEDFSCETKPVTDDLKKLISTDEYKANDFFCELKGLDDADYKIKVTYNVPLIVYLEDSMKLIVDKTKPVVNVKQLTTTNTSPILTGTIKEKNLKDFKITVNGKTYDSEIKISADETWNVQLETLPVGSYPVTYVATDKAGNKTPETTVPNALTINQTYATGTRVYSTTTTTTETIPAAPLPVNPVAQTVVTEPTVVNVPTPTPGTTVTETPTTETSPMTGNVAAANPESSSTTGFLGLPKGTSTSIALTIGVLLIVGAIGYFIISSRK